MLLPPFFTHLAGRRKSVCPYYSARRAAAEADIVLAPYSCLLVRETREALGLRLEGNVIIVDEGHNLGGFKGLIGWSCMR